ncbi:MAG: malto-oligosyltrehalose synthase [Cyclobacteriaceae bacterium]|nr:malto-oligosyltrehalose synthase [Cyclobacteriaceae bacterium]
MHNSTYRIQFNRSFRFSEMEKYADYLDLLGVDTLYASPVFSSTPGSIHGYDVIDPWAIDPELGGEAGFERLSSLLKIKRIDWLQDIVPNHMAFNQHNAWLWDVLEKGQGSAFAHIFDIDWDHPEFSGKLMAPFLGKPFDEVVRDQELKLVLDRGGFHFLYFDVLYPLNAAGFFQICHKNADWPEQLNPILGENRQKEAGKTLEDLPPMDEIKNEIDNLYQTSDTVKNWFNGLLSRINDQPSRIANLHELQHYRLCYWKLTEETINYRRFFTVNGLICLQMEDPRVFDFYHKYLKNLLKKGEFNGLRIDHIDGLRDPGSYLDRLRQITGRDFYLLVEKILESKEELPAEWEVQGTTGYEFLAVVNNLLTNEKQYTILTDLYNKILAGDRDLPDVIYNKKRFILFERMAGELDNLSREFYLSGLIPELKLKNIDPSRIKKALAEFLIAFPIYRLYINSIPPDKDNADVLKNIIDRAISHEPSLEPELIMLLDLFLGQFGQDREKNDLVLRFFKRCMQFTGPLMAKGVEDTTMYYYHQFIAHNEVGDDPGARGLAIAEFHKAMVLRKEKWPHAMNTTSTHDTKRGEDVRARLNVISDLASEWKDLVESWFKMNSGFKKLVNDKVVPTKNEEYLIYQMLAGIWPFTGHPEESLKERLKDYFIKAMREAKTHTAWNEPEETHEEAVISFLFQLLDPAREFYRSFTGFQKKISRFGILNSLAQVVLKMTCPGIPDIYQGTELWDFSMVDPDNRRPVDYDLRVAGLSEMTGNDDAESMFRKIAGDLHSGNVKLWITHILLQERKIAPELFADGDYIPAEITGLYRENFMAFFRRLGSGWILVIVPLHFAAIKEMDVLNSDHMDWIEADVLLPEWCSGPCMDVILKRKMSVSEKLGLGKSFRYLPFLILRSL